MAELYVAAGCFWGAQKAYDVLDGVKDSSVGYLNGTTSKPTYEQVCTDTTGYKEAVRLIYNPKRVSLKTLMDVFFLIVDPTKKDQVGNDFGTQYATGVYFTNEEQHKKLTEIFNEKRKEYQPFYCELAPMRNFYKAEDMHQKYLEKNPLGYCHVGLQDIEQIREWNRKVGDV